PLLRWEKVHILNLGVDFGTRADRLRVGAEFYMKNGRDLIGGSSVLPSKGVSSFTGNTADLRSKGFDLTVVSKNTTSEIFQWATTILYQHNVDQVTSYKMTTGNVSDYISTPQFNPLEGKPLISVY